MDPERLLSITSEGDEFERELLGSIRDVSPPQRAKADTWDGIAGQIATVAVVGAAGATLAATAGASAAAPEAAAAGASAGAVAAAGLKATIVPATTGILRAFATKVVLGTVVAGSTVAAGTTWVRHHHQSVAVTAPAIEKHSTDETAAQRTPMSGQPATGVIDPYGSTADAPAAALPDSPGHAWRPSDTGTHNRLSVESQMLTDARAELRSGDARGALATLDRLQVRSPKGILGQEREVLTIQALAAIGNNDAAKRRAKAFILAYPNSPHSTQLRHIAEDP